MNSFPNSSRPFARRNGLTIALAAAVGVSAAHAGNAESFTRRLDLANGSLHSHPLPSDGLAAMFHLPPRAPHSTSKSMTAQRLRVTSCRDDGSAGTLRAVLASAVDGDTIDLGDLTCSTISLAHGALTATSADLKIQGPGIAALVIDGGMEDRVLVASKDISIYDVTLAHGATQDVAGGGCVLANGNLSLTRARVFSCLSSSATDSAAGGGATVFGDLVMAGAKIDGCAALGNYSAGGGGALVGGTIELRNSEVSANIVDATTHMGLGGGLAGQGDVMLVGSSVSANSVHAMLQAYGGGAHTQGASALVLAGNSHLSSNTLRTDLSRAHGAGVNLGIDGEYLNPSLTVEHSVVADNKAEAGCMTCEASGGALATRGGFTIIASTIANNGVDCVPGISRCTAVGGAFSRGDTGSTFDMTIANSTVSGNFADGGNNGGTAAVLGAGGGLLTIHNSTIAFNEVTGVGSAIEGITDGTEQFDIVSSIIANNEQADFGAFPGGTHLVLSGANDLIENPTSDVTLPQGTMRVDPQLLPLDARVGGTTAVHPLAPNSPALDHGSNPDNLKCDQRGFPYRRQVGLGVDIGAYEEQGEPHIFADGFDGDAACN